MKKQLSVYILSAFLFISIAGFALQKDYPIKKINGTEYYQYTVQASEGLFAIGRKFMVSPEEISKANPEIKNGLKVGQQILIPVQKNKVQPTAPKNGLKKSFIEHVVAKKQTLFAISNKYNVSQEDIKKYNPEIESGLREGMVLRIPLITKETIKTEVEKAVSEKPIDNSTKQKKEDKKSTVIHIVQPDETLYSISRRYKVEVAEIIEINPASATKLTIGTELKIPIKEVNTTSTAKKKGAVIDTVKQEYDINKLFDNGITTKKLDKNRTIRIAFLLPFMLGQEKKDASIDRFLDFYAGALLAIKEAKENGISFEIHTYDTENSEEKLIDVLANSELKTMDLIIGPAFTNQVSLVGDFAKTNRINTLIPFTSKISDIDTNPYLFQFNSGADAELDFATELFTGKYKNMHIIFAELPGISSSDEGKILAENLKKELKKANRPFLTLELSTSDAADFGNIMQYYEKNLVIFNTDKYAYVSPFLTPLNAASESYQVVLFEQYSWRNQSDKRPKSMCFSPFTTTSNPDKLSNYNKEFTFYYGKVTGKETPRYDLLGYDLTSYFTILLNMYGTRFTDKIGSFTFNNGLQSKPQFERLSNGSGFVNKRVYLIED